MLLVFIDETSDSKFKNYFGISCSVINSSFYRKIKENFQTILSEAGWDTEIEFKGSYLFSASSGDLNITIEERIDIASKVLALNTSKQNARMKFYYLKKSSKNFRQDYLTFLPILLEKALSQQRFLSFKTVTYLSKSSTTA